MFFPVRPSLNFGLADLTIPHYAMNLLRQPRQFLLEQVNKGFSKSDNESSGFCLEVFGDIFHPRFALNCFSVQADKRRCVLFIKTDCVCHFSALKFRTFALSLRWQRATPKFESLSRRTVNLKNECRCNL